MDRQPTGLLRLSYRQLGERLGIAAEAARSLARRRHWQRVTGNDGVIAVLVDEAELEQRPSPRPPGQPPRPRPDRSVAATAPVELWQRIAVLEAQRDDMAVELLAATTRAAHAEGEAQALRDALADLAGRLDAATAELRRPWWHRLIGW